MYYLVTGGAGFIGSHLVDALLAAGNQVVVVDNLSTGHRENLPSDIEFIEGDICDRDTIEPLLQKVDGCFHLAAIASVQKANEAWRMTHEVNLSATVQIFDIIASSKKTIPVVFASSAAIYGDNPNVPLKETEHPQPLNAYGADKLGCELHGKVASHIHGIPNIGLRFFNVYGPRQDPSSPYSGVISIFTDRIKQGKAITINGDGEQCRDFIYVADVVKGCMAAMESLTSKQLMHDVINMCRGKATTIRTLARTIQSICDQQVEYQHGDAPKGDIIRSIGNPDRLLQQLHLVLETGLEEGLQQLCAS